jgi:hypothetical protein
LGIGEIPPVYWGLGKFSLFIGDRGNSACSLGIGEIPPVHWGLGKFRLFIGNWGNSTCPNKIKEISRELNQLELEHAPFYDPKKEWH